MMQKILGDMVARALAYDKSVDFLVIRKFVSGDRLLLLYNFYNNIQSKPELSEIPVRMQKSDNVEGLFCCTVFYVI